jgi:hypothetical protein
VEGVVMRVAERLDSDEVLVVAVVPNWCASLQGRDEGIHVMQYEVRSVEW